jgi:hypothetical protein
MLFSAGSRVRTDVDALYERMERRLYPETTQALALYWLKTLWNKGYTRDEWKRLDDLLEERLASDTEPECRRQAFTELRTWIGDARHEAGQSSRGSSHSASAPQRSPLDAEALVRYLVRLMNEWLPVELARLLIADEEAGEEPDSGIPAVATGRALERLLRRERLTAATLEAMLEPGLMSPRLIYPGDYEILRDVVLYLLGRTEASASPIMPAALLFIAPGAHLSSNYAAAVEQATLVEGQETEELQVPIAPDQAIEALTGEHVRITSRVVTMDGRWWEADRLSGGEQNIITYRPAGLVRIDYTADHARIQVPWPEARYQWSGLAHFGPVVHVFGREWNIGQWEQDADHTWLHLIFSRWLAPEEMGLEARPQQRATPAAVDLAWAALEDTLALCFHEKRADPIDKLRREEMIPLARAIFALMEAASDAHLRDDATIEARLRAVGFFATAAGAAYGRVRWRVLPGAVRKILLTPSLYPALSEIFEGLPEAPRPRILGPRVPVAQASRPA